MFQYVSYTNIQILWLASADIWVCDLTYMRGKETQVKRKSSIIEGTGTHNDTCSPQVWPFPVIPICSEMHPQTWMLGSAALLSPSGEHFHQEAICSHGSGGYLSCCRRGEWIVITPQGKCLIWVSQTSSSFLWTKVPPAPTHLKQRSPSELVFHERSLLSYTCLSQAISQIFW